MLVAAAVPAFWPLYLSRAGAGADGYTHFHAAAMTAWCGLLVTQPLLAAGATRPLHRALGRVSYALVPMLVISTVPLASARFRAMDEATFARDAWSLFLPLSGAFLFSVSYGLAVAFRRVPALHARFMVGTALPLVDPIVGRLLFFYVVPSAHPLVITAVTFGGTDVVLAYLAIRNRHQPASAWAYPLLLAIFATVHLLWFTLAQSPSWTPVARAFRALPLT